MNPLRFFSFFIQTINQFFHARFANILVSDRDMGTQTIFSSAKHANNRFMLFLIRAIGFFFHTASTTSNDLSSKHFSIFLNGLCVRLFLFLRIDIQHSIYITIQSISFLPDFHPRLYMSFVFLLIFIFQVFDQH